MPFHRPIPDSKRPASGMKAYVRAEKLTQIAFVLPAAVVLCWGLGWWLDHRFNQTWIEIVGVIFGCIAGMVSVVRIALDAEKDSRREDPPDENGKGTPPQKP